MFRRFACLLLVPAVMACVGQKPLPPGENEASKELRILAIGNSFSSDAVDQNLYDLFLDAGYTVVIGDIAATGSSLEDHWKRACSQEKAYSYTKIADGKSRVLQDVDLDTVLLDEAWDIVTLQQASAYSDRYETYLPFAKDLARYVASKTHAKLVWHQTWSYGGVAFENETDRTQLSMYEAIADASRKVAEEAGFASVIPTGTAVQMARRQLGDVLNRDFLHLELTYGRYLASCTWFEALTGKSVVGNGYHPDTVAEERAKLCQEIAHGANRHPFQLTGR